jgi:DNA repair protein RadA/Sms
MNTGSTSTDLAVALAIYSSFKGRTSSKRLVAAGEVGLTGNLRSVPNAGKIVQEALRLGYEAVILPAKNAGQAAKASGEGIRVMGAANISDAIRAYLS